MFIAPVYVHVMQKLVFVPCSVKCEDGSAPQLVIITQYLLPLRKTSENPHLTVPKGCKCRNFVRTQQHTTAAWCMSTSK